MNKIRFAFIALVIAVSSAATVVAGQTDSYDEKQTKWIENVLKNVKKIKVGMTRGELRRVFAEEGGLSTGRNRTYVYRGCPYIKVDVEFEPAGRPLIDANEPVTLVEADGDLIKYISKPYLEFRIVD